MDSPHALSFDVLIESPLWNGAPGAETTLRRALATAAAMLSTTRAELAIVLTDDSAVRELNRQWRGIDRPTNVLSFPARQLPHAAPAGQASSEPVPLGDIVIAYETTVQEARNESKSLDDHLAH